MKLYQLLENVTVIKLSQSEQPQKEVTAITFDSRKSTDGSLFVAVRGTRVDGHDYIQSAVKKRATAVVLEKMPDYAAEYPGVTWVQVADSSEALAKIADNYFGHPSQKLNLIGITGTNGKTTTATLLYRLFSQLGFKTGLLSTVENRIAEQIVAATHTTPDPVAINELLREMVEAGCEYAFMEVSSHAIHQNRVAGLIFRGGIFTNLSHDHLDYHKTYKEYIYAKKKFFDQLPESAFALTNADDKQGRVMVQNTAAQIVTYGLKNMADYKARILDNRLEGLHLSINGQEVFCRLVGVFNAYNLLSVFAAGHLLGFSNVELLTILSNLKPAEGRFEVVSHKEIMGIVDYAHTPDALQNVLETIRQVARKEQRIITLIGCGGNRDAAKRPVMAKVAVDWSDLVILTSDNPRNEEPEAILKDMEEGVPAAKKHKTLTISNRLQAIRIGCRLAKPGDILLVAGKGHEKYQEINGEKFPFDDKQTLINELHQL